MSVADLKTQLAKLKAKRASGTAEVQFADRKVRYRDDVELQRAIGALEQEIAALEGTATPRNLTVVANKGY